MDFISELYGDAAGYLTIWTRDKRTLWFHLPDERPTLPTGTDVYFGVGLGDAPAAGRLTADAVTVIPGLWMDVDLAAPGRPPTAKDAAKLFPVPPTITVGSGSGLHCYWLFREPWRFDSDDERAQAAALLAGFQATIRAAASSNGWHLDSTHDLARVLRVPGTMNYKSDPPTPVTVLSAGGPRYNYDDLEQYAAEPMQRSTRGDRFHHNPGDGPASVVLDNCKFIQACRDYAAELSEPQWLAMISNVARCSDGPEACHQLSRPYPRYSERETDDKIAHALRDMHPQSCEYIRNTLGFNQCPPGGCDVKAPCVFALRRAPAVPDDFFNETTDAGISRYTDLGNAEYFARYYDGRVKYCPQMDKWLIWDGVRWSQDSTDSILVLAGRCVRSMYDMLSSITDDDQRKKLFNHAMKSENAMRLQAMVKLARGHMPILIDALDADPWLLNCPNGIIDLRTGTIRDHDPAANMTKTILPEYDASATCPTFENFLASTFDGNTAVIGFMRRLLGYCLTGDTREQQFAIAWGSGRNGKGTLLNLICDIMQDYAKTTPTEVLYSKKFDKPSNDIARLAGARFVLASEGERGRKLDEPLVKKMTGQDTLAARFLYKETFEFVPQFKLILMTNDKPVASEDDAALWARIQLIPFTRRFDGDAQDKSLKTKLRAEAAGILQWLIRGCLEWQRVGLTPPEAVVNATREYRSENDKLQDWIDENCVTGDDKISSPKELYRNFQSWCLKNGERYVMIFKNFNAALGKKGYQKFVGTAGYQKMRGIALLPRDSGDLYDNEQPF